MIKKEHIVCVVLSGGVGSRLWPVSREGCPKPFVKLRDGETLIRKTYERVKMLGAELLTVTNRDYYLMSRDEEKRAGISGDFLLEPFARNTAPAIAVAAKFVAETHGLETVMVVLAADHLIGDQANFSESIRKATNLALDNYLVTLGIVPTSAETGFGYIEQGAQIHEGYKVAAFVEKPNLEIAKNYLASGKHLWNSGIFCFKAGVLLDELNKNASDVAALTEECWDAIKYIDSDVIEIPEDVFVNAPDISIDYALMENSEKVAVVRGFFDWSDVGSWAAMKDLIPADGSHNRVVGNAILVESENVFVQGEGRLIATVGVNKLIIVDTPDALLVMNADKTQDIKKLVAQLESVNHQELRSHSTVMRPWGSYTILQEALGFKIKRIEVKPNASLSLQMHHHRSEHWVVVSGIAQVQNGTEQKIIQKGESTFIPIGRKHRLTNPGSELCVIIEVQCGNYLGEDDIVRFDDQYGRS